jgi:WD40 repeat protein
VWDTATGEGRALTGHTDSVQGALLLPDGHVLSWGFDRTLQVWDMATGEERALTGHTAPVHGALLMPDGHVLSWGFDRCLRRQPIEYKSLGEAFYFDGNVTVAVSTSASGKQFFIGDTLGRVHFLEVVETLSHHQLSRV